MTANPLLKKLGYADDDRVVIFHADDVGMCQASVEVFRDLVGFGLLSSGATMVPCSWFPAVAAFCREQPTVDLGVHLTLTSEWDTYRWGPISTGDTSSGMMDEEGYFYRTSDEAKEHGDPAAVQVEIETQIERALAAGVDVTHIDGHMGAILHPKYLSFYLQAAAGRQIPAMFFRWGEARLRERVKDEATIKMVLEMVKTLEAQEALLVDNLVGMPLHEVADDRIEQAKAKIAELPPGLTHFVMHPAKDTPELRAIAPDWRGRVGDYEAFCSEALGDFVRQEGIQVIGYRVLRDLLRG